MALQGFSDLATCQLDNLPVTTLDQWLFLTPPPPSRFPLVLLSPLTPPYLTLSPPYVPMSPIYQLASLTPPPFSPLMENLLLESPTITSPQDLSPEALSLPPLRCLSSNQVRKKVASKKKNTWQHLHLCLKWVFRDYLKEFSPEEVEREILGQMSQSLKGHCSLSACRNCLQGGWCDNLHHCYQMLQDSANA